MSILFKKCILYLLVSIFFGIITFLFLETFNNYKKQELANINDATYKEYYMKWKNDREKNILLLMQWQKPVLTKKEVKPLNDILNEKTIKKIIHNWYEFHKVDGFDKLSNEDKKYLFAKDKIINLYNLYIKIESLTFNIFHNNNLIEASQKKQLLILQDHFYKLYFDCNIESECFKNQDIILEYIKSKEQKIDNVIKLTKDLLMEIKNQTILKRSKNND